ncbi:MAG: trypsin-like peptidase domain-containing protein [archaeon]
MPLKRHHKIMIGGFSTFLIGLLIANSVFIYVLYGQLQLSYTQIEGDILDLQTDTQSKFNELTSSLVETKSDLAETRTSLNMQIESFNEEFDMLKASTSADFSGIIEEAVKGVVTIRTDVGQGTGFLITNDGYIVTNSHVLVGGRKVYALTYNEDTIEAEFIGYDTDFDIALLKIDGNYNRLRLADSDDVEIGEKVIAIGNPLGLQFSVSEGIVSGVNRAGPNGLEAYIQTDAALNPGNSGGPLINKEGRVIGINNFKVGGSESLGFALESNFIEAAVNGISLEVFNETLI